MTNIGKSAPSLSARGRRVRIVIDIRPESNVTGVFSENI